MFSPVQFGQRFAVYVPGNPNYGDPNQFAPPEPVARLVNAFGDAGLSPVLLTEKDRLEGLKTAGLEMNDAQGNPRVFTYDTDAGRRAGEADIILTAEDAQTFNTHYRAVASAAPSLAEQYIAGTVRTSGMPNTVPLELKA